MINRETNIHSVQSIERLAAVNATLLKQNPFRLRKVRVQIFVRISVILNSIKNNLTFFELEAQGIWLVWFTRWLGTSRTGNLHRISLPWLPRCQNKEVIWKPLVYKALMGWRLKLDLRLLPILKLWWRVNGTGYDVDLTQTYNSHVRNISVATLWTIQTLQVIEGQFHLCSVKIKHGDAMFSFYAEQIINELPETANCCNSDLSN